MLVRNCIQAMIGENVAETFGFKFQCNLCGNWEKLHLNRFANYYFFYFLDPLMEPYPHQFATALFSFLYHLASYDAGGEALVSCGMMEALLKVHFLTKAFLLKLPFVNLVLEIPLSAKNVSKYINLDSS